MSDARHDPEERTVNLPAGTLEALDAVEAMLGELRLAIAAALKDAAPAPQDEPGRVN